MDAAIGSYRGSGSNSTMRGFSCAKGRCLRYVLVLWVCLVNSASSSSFRGKSDPKADPKSVEFMKKWENKEWTEAKKSCDTEVLPSLTDAFVKKVCGNDSDKKRCVCIIAKAHSCHIGCTELGGLCPQECNAGGHQGGNCWQGAPGNGGLELSKGGTSGTCLGFCSQKMGGVRYCGNGPAYKSGLFLDCRGCSPQPDSAGASKKDRKKLWSRCMSGCYPTPTCSEMCGEGTPECYTQCVEDYKHVVDPFWNIFKDSTTNLISNHGGTNQTVTMVSKEDMPAKQEEQEVEEVKESVEEEEEYEDESYEDEYGDGDGEEEWEDPWAGENDWDEDYDEDEYYDLMLRHNKFLLHNVFGVSSSKHGAHRHKFVGSGSHKHRSKLHKVVGRFRKNHSQPAGKMKK